MFRCKFAGSFGSDEEGAFAMKLSTTRTSYKSVSVSLENSLDCVNHRGGDTYDKKGAA